MTAGPEPRKAEIEDLDGAFRRANHVLGFQIAVHQTARVRGGQGLRDADGSLEQASARQRSAPQLGAQRLAGDVFR